MTGLLRLFASRRTGCVPQARTRLPMSNSRVRVGYTATHPKHGTRPLFRLPMPRRKPGGEVERGQGQQNERVGVRVGAKRQYRVQVKGRQFKQGQRRVGEG